MKKSDKNKVYEAYNQIIHWFDRNRNKDLVMEKHYLNLIQEYIPCNATILDVGCGTGEPMAKFFIECGYEVTGIDASIKMIELCKQRFPKQKWILSDMRDLHLNKQFDLVIAWHSLFHLPSQDQINTLHLLCNHVKQNGLLVFTAGYEAGEAWGENGGVELYHASLSSGGYEKILKQNNFKILVHKIKDPQCGEATVWVAQRNPENVYVGKGDLAGKAVYASRNLKKGETVIQYRLTPLTLDEYNQLSDYEKQFTHSHWGTIYLYSEPERYVNHSNNPNTYQDLIKQQDIALRDIKKDEMITGDATKDDIE